MQASRVSSASDWEGGLREQIARIHILGHDMPTDAVGRFPVLQRPRTRMAPGVFRQRRVVVVDGAHLRGLDQGRGQSSGKRAPTSTSACARAGCQSMARASHSVREPLHLWLWGRSNRARHTRCLQYSRHVLRPAGADASPTGYCVRPREARRCDCEHLFQIRGYATSCTAQCVSGLPSLDDGSAPRAGFG